MRPRRRILEVVPQPELRAKVQHYWDQLEQHSSTMGKAPTCAVRSIYRGSGASGLAQFELWVINIDSRAVPFFLWERWSCDNLTEAAYQVALSDIREVTAKAHVAFEPRRSWHMGGRVAEPPLWRYHPGRFAAMMPFAKAVERAATVEHSKELVGPKGENNNQAEELNWRQDRAERGIYLNIEPKYLLDYAAETAFRSDTRRLPNGKQLQLSLATAMSVGPSKFWTGFTHGRHRKVELLHPKPMPAAASGPPKGRNPHGPMRGMLPR